MNGGKKLILKRVGKSRPRQTADDGIESSERRVVRKCRRGDRKNGCGGTSFLCNLHEALIDFKRHERRLRLLHGEDPFGDDTSARPKLHDGPRFSNTSRFYDTVGQRKRARYERADLYRMTKKLFKERAGVTCGMHEKKNEGPVKSIPVTSVSDVFIGLIAVMNQCE